MRPSPLPSIVSHFSALQYQDREKIRTGSILVDENSGQRFETLKVKNYTTMAATPRENTLIECLPIAEAGNANFYSSYLPHSIRLTWDKKTPSPEAEAFATLKADRSRLEQVIDLSLENSSPALEA